MEIKINGEAKEVSGELTVAQLLDELKIDSRNLAVEYNGDFLTDEDFGATVVRAGDTLEIVRFVGGG